MSRIRMQARKRWDYSPVLVPLQAVIYSNTSITGSGDEVNTEIAEIVLNVPARHDQSALMADMRQVSESIEEESAFRDAFYCENPCTVRIEGMTWLRMCIPGLFPLARVAVLRQSGSEIQAITMPSWSVDGVLTQADVYRWETSRNKETDKSVLKTILLDGHPGVGLPTNARLLESVRITREEFRTFLELTQCNNSVRGARTLLNHCHSSLPWFLSYWYYFGDKVVTTLLCKLPSEQWVRERRITHMGSNVPDSYVVDELPSLTVDTDLPADLKPLPEGVECILRGCDWEGFINVRGLQEDLTQGGETEESASEESSGLLCHEELDRWEETINALEIPEALSSAFLRHQVGGLHIPPSPLNFESVMPP